MAVAAHEVKGLGNWLGHFQEAIDKLPFALVKAGAVTDADFPEVPPDNTTALDTTNLRIYVRVGGTWRYTALT